MTDAELPHKARIERRIEELIQDFDQYLTHYDKCFPFKKPGQLQSHVDTIHLRRELGSAFCAATDREFCNSLYRTLREWGIGTRGSHPVSCEAFADALAACASEIAKLDGLTIDDPALDVPMVAGEVWRLIESLGIVTNDSKIVSGTKTMHHLLPDLVVPVDRTYTQVFFGFQNSDLQYGAKSKFPKMFDVFARIARRAGVNRYVGTGEPWRTSRTKVIDNALVDYVESNLKRSSSLCRDATIPDHREAPCTKVAGETIGIP